MRNKETGGPAFPCEWDYIESSRSAANGMTLRDYFAAKALPALIAECAKHPNHPVLEHEEYVAINAYVMADAMIKARAS